MALRPLSYALPLVSPLRLPRRDGNTPSQRAGPGLGRGAGGVQVGVGRRGEAATSCGVGEPARSPRELAGPLRRSVGASRARALAREAADRRRNGSYGGTTRSHVPGGGLPPRAWTACRRRALPARGVAEAPGGGGAGTAPANVILRVGQCHSASAPSPSAAFITSSCPGATAP